MFKFTLATLALFAATAVAQFPSCAVTCLDPSTAQGCGPTDNTCLCNSQAFVDATTRCIQTSCSPSDAETAQSAARQLCAAVGVTLTSQAPATSTESAPESSATSPPASSPPATSSGASSTSSGASTSTSAAPPAQTSNAASFNGIPTYAGMAALGLAALAL